MSNSTATANTDSDPERWLAVQGLDPQGLPPPTIRSCGACGWHVREPGEGWVCWEPRARLGRLHVVPSQSPPRECPLRAVDGGPPYALPTG